ncbi:Uncharacterized protein TCM_025262 [Theobroma cacao]|uniref:Uncharacterized protein n=1 Tax=Theobroma cacao TaxID=3641 RepID=A0A061EXS6_THECC|nr:Uncharacterized protein TCM_025262 [Theobroma cacao]
MIRDSLKMNLRLWKMIENLQILLNKIFQISIKYP